MTTSLLCGSRNWTDQGPIRAHLQTLPRDTAIVHGAARGADQLVDTLARELGFTDIRPYPAEWETFGLSAGPRRNQQMLDAEHPHEIIAFKTQRISKGTDNMLSLGRRARLRLVTYLLLDGQLTCTVVDATERVQARQQQVPLLDRVEADDWDGIWGHFSQKTLD